MAVIHKKKQPRIGAPWLLTTLRVNQQAAGALQESIAI